MNYFLKKINEISINKEKKWNNTNKESFGILISAPSCFIRDWNLNYLEIDNANMEEISEILKRMNIQDKENIYGYYEYWLDNAAGKDYEEFKSFWDGKPCLKFSELSDDGQEAFISCKKYAEQFADIVGNGGFYAWDYSEIVQVIRMGFMKGWLNYQEANQLLEQVASGAYRKYNSWKEFAISFICGGTYSHYKDCGFKKEVFDKEVEELAKEFFNTLCGVVQALFEDREGNYWNEPW